MNLVFTKYSTEYRRTFGGKNIYQIEQI